MTKRILAFVLGLALTIGVVPAYAASVQTCCRNTGPTQIIQMVSEDRAVNGVGNNRFNPDGILSVAEWSCILARVFYAGEMEARMKTTWYNREIEVC